MALDFLPTDRIHATWSAGSDDARFNRVAEAFDARVGDRWAGKCLSLVEGTRVIIHRDSSKQLLPFSCLNSIMTKGWLRTQCNARTIYPEKPRANVQIGPMRIIISGIHKLKCLVS